MRNVWCMLSHERIHRSMRATRTRIAGASPWLVLLVFGELVVIVLVLVARISIDLKTGSARD
jgi:hypothetical protein